MMSVALWACGQPGHLRLGQRRRLRVRTPARCPDPGHVLMGGGTMTDAVFPWNSLKGTGGRCTTLLTLDSEPATPLDRGRPGSGSPPCPRSSGPPRRPAPTSPPAPRRPSFSDAALESPWRQGRRVSGRGAAARPGWARSAQARRAQARRRPGRRVSASTGDARARSDPTPGRRPLAAPPAHRGVSRVPWGRGGWGIKAACAGRGSVRARREPGRRRQSQLPGPQNQWCQRRPLPASASGLLG